MKTLNFKSVILAASIVLSTVAVEQGFAQGRGGGSRGGGGGGGGRSSGMASGGGGAQRSSAFQGGGRGQGSTSSFQGAGRSAVQSGGRQAFQGGGRQAFQGGGRQAFQGGRSSFQGGRFGGRPSFQGGGRYGYRGRGGYYGHGFGRPYYGWYNFYRPYLGFSLSVLPYGYYPFYYGDDQFYYSAGLYYRQYNNEYKVVVPPVGAEVPTLPSDAEEVTVNGQTYYEYKGVYYSPVEKADGTTAYVIAGKDGVLNTPDGDMNAGSGARLGDVVSALPQGAREVTVKGQKLYVTEDGIFYEELVDAGHTTYKVVGI